MLWKECHIMDERVRFVARFLDGKKMAPLEVERATPYWLQPSGTDSVIQIATRCDGWIDLWLLVAFDLPPNESTSRGLRRSRIEPPTYRRRRRSTAARRR